MKHFPNSIAASADLTWWPASARARRSSSIRCGNISRYLAFLAYGRLTLDALIDTHTHADHPTGSFQLHAITGARLIMHRRAPAPVVTEHVEHGDTIEVGDAAITVLHTPGHTPDSISLHAGDRVFTGDVLMIGGTGRADFAGGDSGQQYDSITGRLFGLPDETLVLPAHDYRGNTQSSIGHEKRSNPRVAGRSREEYIALMASLNFPMPEKIQEVLQPNQSAIDDDRTRFPDLTALNRVRQLAAEEVMSQLETQNPPLILDVREPDETPATRPSRQHPDPAGSFPGKASSQPAAADHRGMPQVRSTTAAHALRPGLRARLQSEGWHGRMERPEAARRAVSNKV
jgi:glyoxylase-like metal-dependent hydrolase (beta-lactamase superfamily II)